MSKRDRDALSDAVARVIDIRKLADSIAPDHVASGAMRIIGFDYAMHNAGWYGCYQHLLQMARERLRGRFDPEARAEAAAAAGQNQADMFGETLQERYPLAPRRNSDGTWREPEYVLRHKMPVADLWFNIDRLNRVSLAAAKHAEALEAETVLLHGARMKQDNIA